ncbi:peptide methionine sulfoxide reductase [Neoconidiobolus thromboides FSU 785]|nr:peptide methionine sulfoxide reductase [Neoconidiobolus thromboides FSU 785]
MSNLTQLATLAGGCFWGIEHYFKKEFGKAIIKSSVGYTGGNIENPTYRQVCSGKTGHAEAVQLEFDPNQIGYKDLVHFFFRIHDPTTLNKQGNDRGSQYRSAIFYHNEEQKAIAEKVKLEVKDKWKNEIITQIAPFDKWYIAEREHQNYLLNNPGGYCNHRIYW